MADETGGQLGKYQIITRLGEGGFATVFKAFDTDLDRTVALKIPHPPLLADPTFVRRFQQEARMVARLEHPNIITIYEVSQVEGRLFIAMALAEQSLAGWLAGQGRLTWDDTLALLKPVCAALDYAHSQDIVHRDLKPANILLDKHGKPLLTDFGFARLAGESSVSMSLNRGMAGTPAYIALEIWDEKKASAASDIYALGCIVFELLTGQVLFAGQTPLQAMRAHDWGPQFPAAWPQDVPASIEGVLRTTLARDPGARFQTASAVWNALRGLTAVQVAAMPEPAPAQPVSRKEPIPEPPAQPVSRKEPSLKSPEPAVTRKKPTPKSSEPAGGTTPTTDKPHSSAPPKKRGWLFVGSAIVIVIVLVWIIQGSVLGIINETTSGNPSNQVAENADVIAEVGDMTLTRGDFLRNYTPGQNAQETLDQLIEFKLVVQEAREEGLTVDETEIDEQLEQLRASHQSPEAVEAFLQDLNIGSEEELRDVMGQLQIYQEMITNQIMVEQAHVRHILLQASDEAAEAGGLHSQPGQEIATKAERRDEAEELLSEIEAGADFAELAQEHSDDPGSAQQGGDLGWAPRGVFVPSFDEAIFEMEPGEVRLVESQFGWHIIELLEAPEERPLENPQFMQSPVVQEQIDATLVPWLEGLRTTADENNQIKILVEPTTLVPPEPTMPNMLTMQS